MYGTYNRKDRVIGLGMARGIPRPSFLEVPDLFLLLDSPRNRFYHSSDPRGPRQILRGIEEPRSYKIYSSGNRGVKKGPGPRGTRDEEFLVPSLGPIQLIKILNSM